MTLPDTITLIYFSLINLATLLAFGLDKLRAKRASSRVSELTLILMGALGGWPSGFLAMFLFRHKSAKWTFQFKYALGLIPLAAEISLWVRWR